MDFEKAIMDLLKKFVEKEEKKDKQQEVEVTQNADFEAEETAKSDKNEQIETKNDKTEETPKTEETEKEESAIEPQKEMEVQKTEVNLDIPQEGTEAKEEEFDPTKVTPTTFAELESYLEKVDKMYPNVTAEDVLPSYMSLERKEVPTTTKEEIEAEAKETLGAQKASEEQQINEKYDAKVEAEEAQKKTIDNRQREQSDTINTVYDASRVKAENDALKRGLARSSIVCLELSSIEKERAAKLERLGREITESLDSIETELAQIEQQRISALDSLDIAYAIKLQEQIDKKLAELKKQQDAALEYNNKMTQAEQKYNLSVDEKRTKLEASAKEKADAQNAQINSQKQNEQVELITKYFSQFDRAKALAELQKHTEIASKYGADVYYRVYRNLVAVK